MAKTKKKEEIIDFTKPEKISDEQLKRVQDSINDINYVILIRAIIWLHKFNLIKLKI